MIDSGTIIPFALHQLREEVEEHIPELAQENCLSETLLWQEWQSYQKSPHFCNVDTIRDRGNLRIIDPDDLPFIILACQIEAAGIASRNRHLASMGANMIKPEVIELFREYARAKSVELTIMI